MHLVTILLEDCMQKHEQNVLSEEQLKHKSLHKISNGIKSSIHLTLKIYSEVYNDPAKSSHESLCSIKGMII